MKARILLPVLLVALSLVSAFSQNPPGTPGVPSRPRSPEAGKLTTFSLDFPGGTPQQLVAAIEKATGKTLNAIIPTEHSDIKLPPLKMNKVNVYQLFEAIERTSQKTEKLVTGTYFSGANGSSETYQTFQTGYGFRTSDAQSGGLSDDSIWYFYVEKPAVLTQVSPVVQKDCRFYSLTSYLERGLTKPIQVPGIRYHTVALM